MAYGADRRGGGTGVDIEAGGAGRPWIVLGIDFGGTKIALATATVSGDRLRAARIETRADGGAADAVRRTVEAANRLVTGSPGRLVAAGVSTFGVVRDGRVRLAPNVPGWEGLALPAMLRDGLGVQALRVDNDVNAAASPPRSRSPAGISANAHAHSVPRTPPRAAATSSSSTLKHARAPL